MPLTVDNHAELKHALSNLFSAHHTTDAWILLNYHNANTLHFAGSGSGGPETLESKLVDDQVQYGLVRISGIQEKGTLKTTVRDVFFAYIGPNVSIIEKGKKTANLGDAQGFLQPFHADITVLNKKKFNRDEILDKSAPLSGSHVIS
eukprot:Phypoly_transcript_07186.p2 GENE.Phypoly_transcript_07186~~Phypoly_transcript_07186.p2  ORF type:complete len:147 (+),score=30.40 Phypoly_transcript_07186:1165-1605(+)